MAGEIALPAIPGVSALNWTLERNVATFESPLTRASQRISRNGARHRCQLRFPLYNNNDAGVLATFMDQISRGDRWLWLSPPQNSVRGNWNSADLVTNGTFVGDVTTGWTASNSTLSVNARRLKLTTTSAANAQAFQDFTIEANKPYWFMGDFTRGGLTGGSLDFYDLTGAASTLATATVDGRVGAIANRPNTAIRLFAQSSGASAAGQTVHWGGISATRCLQVNGAGQTGNRLNVDGGPTSVNAALRAGEFVTILVGSVYQLVRLTEDFDSDASGGGALVFEPALRAAPADNAVVIVRYPFARFRVAEHMSAQAVEAPNFSGFTLDAIEDVTP